MLAIGQRAYFQTAELKAGRWTGGDNVYLHRKVLGVVGTGHIGASMARLAQAIGMQVLAWTFDPSPPPSPPELVVALRRLDELLTVADVVSRYVKLTDADRGLIGARELRAHEAGRPAREDGTRRGRRHGGAGRSSASRRLGCARWTCSTLNPCLLVTRLLAWSR